MNPTDSQTLQEKFSLLPDTIKEWLASEELVYIVSDIEEKLSLSGEKILIIPRLILRLAVQEVEPQDFTSTLAQELGISPSIAKTIAEDIEKNALRPIEGELRSKIGVETKLIYHPRAAEEKTAQTPSTIHPSKITGPAPLPSTPARPATPAAPQPKPLTPAASSPRPISPLTFTEKKETGASLPTPPQMAPSGAAKQNTAIQPTTLGQPVKPAAPMMPATPTAAPKPQPVARPMQVPEPQPAAAPFILHQEASPTVAPSIAPQQHVTSAPKQSLTMKIQNYYQSMGAAERPITKPVSVKMETAPNPVSAPAAPAPTPAPQPEQARVVHYSSFRTPITAEGTTKIEPKATTPNQNVVDLRKFM